MTGTAVAVFDELQAEKDLAKAVRGQRRSLASLLSIDTSSDRGKAMLDRFVTVALHAATSNPDLLRCTTDSLVESIRQSAILGLEPTGALGDGAIVVYNTKVKREVAGRHGGTVIVEDTVPTAQFQPMYRGLLKLARRSDQVRVIDANVVYQGDTFEVEQGTDPAIRHVPWPMSGSKDRGSYVGVYAFAKLVSGETLIEWATVADIEAIRSSSRAKDRGPWVAFWGEMARAKILRRLMKRLPLESAAEHAIRLEVEAESGAVQIPAETASRESAQTAVSARERLRARLGAGKPDEDAEPPDEPLSVDPRPSGPTQVVVDGTVVATTERHDVEEGVTRDVEDVCGATSPFTEGAFCVLDPHASGPHQASENETWL